MPFQHLPNWILSVVFMLAINAGMINVLGLITVLNQSVSHMTGNVSLFAQSLVMGQSTQVIYLSWVVFSYMVGASCSGFILGNSHFNLGLRYSIPIILVTLFILLCWLFIPYFPRYALLWACIAMGVQNAMISHYQGSIIRTTHLSGVLTDLGLALGYGLKGLKTDIRKIVLNLLILIGFIVGGVIACFAHAYLQLHAFLIPTMLSLTMCVIYGIISYKFSYHQK